MNRAEQNRKETMLQRSVWRNLNVFVAAFAAIASFGSVIVVIPVSMLMKVFLPAREAELVAHPLSLALIAAGLIYWWWKHGLSPLAVNPARERSFRWGHVLLATSNLTLTLIFLPSLLGNLALPRQAPAVTGVLVSLMTLVPIALIAGLVMVSRSRATVPAFADTLPVARDASVRDTTTTWLARQLGEKGAENPDPSGRAPSAIVVVVGLVASSLMLFIAGVFGALGFQSDPSRFTNVVLPILIAMYVFYVSTGIFLLTRRRISAIWVAWAPVGLLTVGVPVLQLIFVLFRSLVGR